MTRDEILKLEGRELDAAVAERVCGWTDVEKTTYYPHGGDAEERVYGIPPENVKCGVQRLVPSFHSDLNAVTEAEKRLVADEQQDWYVDCLEDAANGDRFRTVTADATTRCRALLLAVMEEEK